MPSYSSPRVTPDRFRANPNPPEHHLVAFSDGGARGNPGPAGYGVVVQDEAGRTVAALSQYLGHQTNNVAEYQGLIAALEYALAEGPKALKVIIDSELMVRQIQGVYKVNNLALQVLHRRAQELISRLEWFSIGHVLRGHNEEADRLANAAMDKGMGRVAPDPAVPSGNLLRARQEFNGMVRAGKVEILDGQLPEGTQVQVRVKP